MATKKNDLGPRDRSRVAFERALDGIAEWRKDVADLTERHGERVFDELADAARDAGWPETMIETTRSQVRKLSRTQNDIVDRAISAWEDQLENPHAAAPIVAPTAQFALMPMQFWMQSIDMWRTWSDSLTRTASGQRGGRGREY